MSNEFPVALDPVRQECHYLVRRCKIEVLKLLYDARNRRLDWLLPALHQAAEELKSIDCYDPKTDLKEVHCKLDHNYKLMNSTLEVLEGEQWRRDAKWHQTHLQVTLCRLIKEAYFEGALDQLQSLIDVSNRIDKFDVDDPKVHRSAFDAELSEVRKLIGSIAFKEATDVE